MLSLVATTMIRLLTIHLMKAQMLDTSQCMHIPLFFISSMGSRFRMFLGDNAFILFWTLIVLFSELYVSHKILTDHINITFRNSDWSWIETVVGELSEYIEILVHGQGSFLLERSLVSTWTCGNLAQRIREECQRGPTWETGVDLISQAVPLSAYSEWFLIEVLSSIWAEESWQVYCDGHPT